MEILPQVHRHDTVTKDDLSHLATKADLHREINRLLVWLVPVLLGLSAVVGLFTAVAAS